MEEMNKGTQWQQTAKSGKALDIFSQGLFSLS